MSTAIGSLEYLDGSDNARALTRDSLGRMLPVSPDITSPTEITVRVTWKRPINIDRDDTVNVFSFPSSGITAQTSPASQTVNQSIFSRDYVFAIDPSKVPCTSGPGGTIMRINATVFHLNAWNITGGTPHGLYYYRYNVNIAFRIRHGAAQPAITQQPLKHAVTEGQAATFSVVASGSNLAYQWQRSDDNGQLGDGTDTNASSPVLVNGLPGAVIAVAGGGTDSRTWSRAMAASISSEYPTGKCQTCRPSPPWPPARATPWRCFPAARSMAGARTAMANLAGRTRPASSRPGPFLA